MATKYYTEREPYVVARRPEQTFSIVSLAAIACAIGSFFAGAGLGVLLAGAAIILGLVGAVSALSPSTRGGVVSAFAVVAGFAGVIAAAFKLIAHFVGN
jgi:hypothetical protein